MSSHPATGLATLSIDCGGSGIKASVLDTEGTLHSPIHRIDTPYPLSPARFVEVLEAIAHQLPPGDRVTVGMPGMIRHGVVITTPHYVTRAGPRTRVLPELVEQWTGFDMASALRSALSIPALVLNDAEVHGAGVIAGTGLETVLTLGTGLGSAIFDGGTLAPHMEISRAPMRPGIIFDEYIGEHERKRLGSALWARRVKRVVEALRPVIIWDRVYLGGGNSRRITPAVAERLGDDVVIVPNSVGIAGGARAWTLMTQRPNT